MTLASPETFETATEVLSFVEGENASGRGCALITVTGLSGGSMREIGSLSAVSESGQMAGYVSNGCIDADIALHAREALVDGRIRSLRYGQGSPFVDLRLPCGGSVDLLIDPNPMIETVQATLAALRARRSVRFALDPVRGLLPPGVGAARGAFSARLEPGLRVLLVGKGPPLRAMAAQAMAAGMEVAFASPSTEDREAVLSMGGAEAFALTSPFAPIQLWADPWTAVLLLFHDHHWETEVLKAACQSDAFYIGCLGSARTHASRQLLLEGEGVSSSDLARIRGPIGLVPSQRSARFLAVSALSEIIELHGQRRRSGRSGEAARLTA